MTELERLHHIRNGFRNKSRQYYAMAKAEPNIQISKSLRGTGLGFSVAASDLTQAIKDLTDGLAKLQKDAA